jgi:hypothetical protein
LIPARRVETKTYRKDFEEGENKQNYHRSGKENTCWSLKGALQKET